MSSCPSSATDSGRKPRKRSSSSPPRARFCSAVLLQGLGGAWVRLRFDHTEREELQSFDATLTYYLVASNTVTVVLLAVLGRGLHHRSRRGISFFPLDSMSSRFCSPPPAAFHTLGKQRAAAEQRAPIAYESLCAGARRPLDRRHRP